jgi:pyruvate dehydrogenase E1 component beta subunit
MPELTYREAVRGALSQAMRQDDSVFIMGEDIAEMGGSMGVTQGMLAEFGSERVRNTPISEMAIVGTGIGAAIQGMHPVIEIMYEDFLTLSMEQLVNQAAKHRTMSGGQLKVPLTIRTQGGAGWSPGAQHAQQLEAWFVHVPGLKVVYAATAEDVGGLLLSSIYDDNPVVFFEHRLLYPLKGDVPEEVEQIPLGQARVLREGTDVTVVAIGRLVHEALKAAEQAEQDGISVEVLDPRTLQPLDEETIVGSVRKTTRCVTAHEAIRRLRRGARCGHPARRLRLPRRADRARGGEIHPAALRAQARGVVRAARRRRARGGQAHRRAQLMATEVKLPRLGQGMESGTIVKWLKSEGEAVSKREPLYELDTDKVTQEVEAEAEGVLLKIVVPEGEVEVGRTIAVIGEEGETYDLSPADASESSNGAAATAEAPAEPEPGREEREAVVVEPAEGGVARAEGRVKASPLARRIAREKGIDLAQLQGTGPEGRIIAEDVEKAAAAPPPAAAPAPALAPAGEIEEIELTSTRKTIARRLTEAWQAPVFQLQVSADLTRVLDVRERLVQRLREGEAKPTVNDVLTKLVARALVQHPPVNAHFLGDRIVRFPSAHVGIAVAAPGWSCR